MIFLHPLSSAKIGGVCYHIWLFLFFFKIFKNVYECFAVCICTMTIKAREKCGIPWTWSNRQLSTAMWVLGVEAGSSERAISTLNHSSPLPCFDKNRQTCLLGETFEILARQCLRDCLEYCKPTSPSILSNVKLVPVHACCKEASLSP